MAFHGVLMGNRFHLTGTEFTGMSSERKVSPKVFVIAAVV